VKTDKRVFITDCEGPISKNDNAFELTSQFIPDGDHFFKQLSRYDDILSYVDKRKGYNAGDTLRLIVPFLKAYGVTNEKISSFSAHNLVLMPCIKEAMKIIIEMPSFIVSTSFEHYIKALCSAIGFPFKNTYCTNLDIDSHFINSSERRKLMRFRQQICRLPQIATFDKETSLEDLPAVDQQTIRQLDDIFWEKIANMESGMFLDDVKPVGGDEKANATEKIADRVGTDLSEVIYFGDSITDVECFRLVRQSGGLTISFNGNRYAVREAEVAIISSDTLSMAVIAQVFAKLGHRFVRKLVDHWEPKKLVEFQVNSKLANKIIQSTSSEFFKISLITEDNVEKLSRESSTFRSQVRGEEIGKLG
jgi:energy-converting hydrogenase A subunit R